jgi:HdeA/HdeB family
MNGKAAVVLLSGILFACAPAPSASVPSATSSATPPAAVAPSLEHNVVTIRAVNCDAFLSLPEDDRASASLFYLGYTAARRRQTRIDIAEVEGLEAAALGNCAARPDQPAASAFMKAFIDNGR